MKIRVRYCWQRWAPVRGTATIEIPDDFPGGPADYIASHPVTVAAKIVAVKNCHEHCGNLTAALETGYAELRLISPAT